MKIFELSKELSVENKELIQIASELGFEVKSHLSILSDEQVKEIKAHLQNDEQDNKQEEVKKTKEVKQVNKVHIKPNLDLQRMICVKNISEGKLIYISKRQIGYTLIWEKYGDKNYIELGEFINLKNSDPRFVREPWIRVIEDDEIEILKYANVYQYYKDIIEINDIDALFRLSFDQFVKKFEKFPDGYKRMVTEQARKLIASGELDSRKLQKYLEEKMDTDLEISFENFNQSKKNNYIELK